MLEYVAHEVEQADESVVLHSVVSGLQELSLDDGHVHLTSQAFQVNHFCKSTLYFVTEIKNNINSNLTSS